MSLKGRDWEGLRRQLRISRRGAEAISGDVFRVERVGVPHNGKLARYLATRPKPLEDPVDVMAQPLSDKEQWLRDVLNVCED
jgi:hypothetical protein